MSNTTASIMSVLSSIIPHRKSEMALSVLGDHLEIKAGHRALAHHAIEDLGVMINGEDVVEEEYSTQITDTEEVVTIVLPFEPKAGDVIVVDTAVQKLGSKKITLKVQ